MTTTDLHDTALPRFEDRLWDELSALHRQRQDQRPTVVTPHKPGRRRRPLAIGAAVAVAAATTLVIGIATLPGGKPRPAAATVEERIVAATHEAFADSVIHVTDDFVPSSDALDIETWSDPVTNSVRSVTSADDGTALWDSGPAVAPQPGDEAPDISGFDLQPLPDCSDADDDDLPDCDPLAHLPEGYPTVTTRYVQHCDATYIEREEPYWGYMHEALEVQDEIEAGRLVADGTEVIEGQELIRLRSVHDGEGLPAEAASEQRVYVDPATYLPVLARSDIGGPDENVLRYEYLPRTAANLALTATAVPGSYTQVDELADCS